ncbi:MAG: hypothetical protein U1F43_38125 [Myxococcota bacterium]
MSKPRPIVPGQVVAVTRRTVARKFLLLPEAWVGDAFGYLLAHCAAQHEIGVVAGVVMSDHYHLMVVDRAGRLPAFMNELNAGMARVVNAMRGRAGAVWDERQPHYQAMLDPRAALSVAAYQLANPVAAALVEHGREWPGFRTTANQVGRALVFARPSGARRRGRDVSADGDPGAGGSAVVGRRGRGAVRGGARDVGGAAGGRRAAAGGGGGAALRGRRAGDGQDWNGEAVTAEARGRAAPVAAASDEARLVEYVSARRRFIALHAAAKAAFVAGTRDVVFPFGTWLMRVVFGASVARAPACGSRPPRPFVQL